MNTVAEFRDVVWWLLGDDLDSPEHSQDAVDRAVKQVFMCNLIDGFAYNSSTDTITPDLVLPTYGSQYMQIGAQAAYSFVRVEPEFTSNRTRAYAETSRKSELLQRDLQDMIYKLRNGPMFFAGWQSLYSWLMGVAGLTGRDVGFMLTRLNVQVPIGQVTVTAGGLVSS